MCYIEVFRNRYPNAINLVNLHIYSDWILVAEKKGEFQAIIFERHSNIENALNKAEHAVQTEGCQKRIVVDYNVKFC